MNVNLENKLISCIIITYNQNKFLFDAIDSVLSQDYEYIELIIADDCSSDFEKSSIEKYIQSKKTGSVLGYLVY